MAHARKFIREPGVFGYDGHNIPYENHGQYKNQKRRKVCLPNFCWTAGPVERLPQSPVFPAFRGSVSSIPPLRYGTTGVAPSIGRRVPGRCMVRKFHLTVRTLVRFSSKKNSRLPQIYLMPLKASFAKKILRTEKISPIKDKRKSL